MYDIKKKNYYEINMFPFFKEWMLYKYLRFAYCQIFVPFSPYTKCKYIWMQFGLFLVVLNSELFHNVQYNMVAPTTSK